MFLVTNENMGLCLYMPPSQYQYWHTSAASTIFSSVRFSTGRIGFLQEGHRSMVEFGVKWFEMFVGVNSYVIFDQLQR